MFKLHIPHKRTYKKTTQLSIISFISSIGFSGIVTIWSLYLNSFGISESTIGFIASYLTIIALIVSIFSTILLEKINEYKVVVATIIIYIISYLIIAFYKNLTVFIIVSSIIAITGVFRINSFDILFRDESKTKELNQAEGLLYSLLNLGYLIGPIIASFILYRYNINSVFFSSTIFITIGLIILLTVKIPYHKKNRLSIDSNIFKNLLDYVKNKKLKLPYLVSTGIYIWWALIYIYIPLFIIKAGLGEETIGIFFSAIVIPLVLFEYKIGKLSEKYGFRSFFFLGFLILGIIGIFLFFITNIYIIILLIIIASIPMAALEPLQDSFFFHKVRAIDEEKYYPIYATSGDIGSFIGKFSIAGILIFLPDKYAYLITAIFMIIISIYCLKIKDK